jgi:hypothetical protein
MFTFRSIGYLGRLGNQMFQFASTLGVAEKRKSNALFPVSNCYTVRNNGPIDPKTRMMTQVKCDLMDCFDIPSEYFVPLEKINPKGMYQESNMKFDPAVFDLPEDCDLFGYFQTEKYFSHMRGKLLDIFKFRWEFEKIATDYWIREVVPFSGESEIVSIHVRRGDYTLYPDHHPTCSKEYYDLAISSFGENSKFLVFSDDIEWCKNNFSGERFHFADTGSPYSDLKLMTMCRHHVNANSSFSWWGSWLNTKDGKRVVCPSRWFGPAIPKDVSDIYCENWEVI